MELLHIADKQGNSMGQATRHEAISQGHSLLSAHVWIYNDNQEVLLQKRATSPLITCCPGMWDNAAAGYVSAGELPKYAAIREAQEEIGLAIAADELEELHIHESEWMNHHEFQTIYLYKYNGSINSLSTQPEEVDELKRISIVEFIKEVNTPETFALYVNHSKDYYDIIIEALQKKL